VVLSLAITRRRAAISSSAMQASRPAIVTAAM
jgi:hypothetical protein